MSMSIQRHSESYAPFMDDAAVYARRDRVAAVSESEVADQLRGPSIMAGLHDTRRVAVDTSGMGTEHAYHQQPSFSPYDSGGGSREWDPNTGYQPSEYDERRSEEAYEGEQADDESGYNWGPAPHHDPGAEAMGGEEPLQPLDQLLNQHESERYLHPREEPPAHFSSAHHGAVAADGLAAKLAFPVQPAQPQQPAEPVWLGHTFAPSHRVALPWRDQIIQGTVTHLDGTNVGVRWDDGQHSVEEPSAIRPLY